MDAGKNEDVETRLRSADEDKRLHAVLELREDNRPGRIKMLVDTLEKENSRLVHEACVFALICIGTEEVAEEVAGLLRHRDAFLRNAASEILQMVGENSERVIAGLLDDPDPDVRHLAVRALGRGEMPSAASLLREVVLNDDDVNVVGSAAEYLGERGGAPEDVEALRLACRRFSDPYLDFVVEEALAKIGAN